MLVLTRINDRFPDDTDPAITYRLPTGLTPLPGPDGTPQAVISRSPDGGLLHLRLGAAWPQLNAQEKHVPFSAGRFRLVLKTPIDEEAGQWRDTPTQGDTVVNRSVSLDPIETAIAKRISQSGGDLIDVEVELDIRGLAPMFPWLVRAESDMIQSRIAALLGPTPATWERVEAAFLGLSKDTFTWYPLEPGAVPPPTDQAMLAIAHHAAPTLLTKSQGGWSLTDSDATHLDVSLAVPRTQTQRFGLRWSFSEFLAAQPDPGLHLIDLDIPAPFVAADIHVVNDVPLADSGIRGIGVEIRTGGPSGIVRHEFLPGQPSSARLRFVRETFEDLALSGKTRTTVDTANGPTIVENDLRPSGLMVEINTRSLNLTPLRFLAQPAIFEHVASLEVIVGRRTLSLTPTSPQAWAVGRRPPATVDVWAVLDSGDRAPLGAMAISGQGLTFDLAFLEVGQIKTVTLQPPTNIDQQAAYLAVQIEGGPWRTIDPGATVTWPVRQANRFQPPQLRYRTRHVPRSADGTTRPITESTWRNGVGPTVTLEV